MRRIGKKFWLFCLVAGLGLMALGGVMGGGKRSLYLDRNGIHTNVSAVRYGKSGGDMVTVSDKNLPSFTDVDIDVVSMPVTIITADYYGMELSYPEDRDIRWEVKNGTLIVKDHTRNAGSLRISMFEFGFNDNLNGSLTIYRPDNDGEQIKVSVVSGDIRIDGVNADKFLLESVSGNIRVDDCEATKLNAETVSGEIDLTGVESEELRLESVSGEITADLNASYKDYSFAFSTVSGDVRVDGERLRKARDDFRIDNPSAPYSLEAATVSGGITVQFD